MPPDTGPASDATRTAQRAFAPGGFEAMIAMAVALDLDPAFVSAAHVSRVMALTLLLPVIFRLRG